LNGKSLSALDPGKQGLKPGIVVTALSGLWLSALDPGKQGLKQSIHAWPQYEPKTFSA